MKPSLLTARAGAVSVAAAILYVMTEFGVTLTQGQQTAIMTLVAVVSPYVTAWLVRRKVIAPAPPKTDE